MRTHRARQNYILLLFLYPNQLLTSELLCVKTSNPRLSVVSQIKLFTNHLILKVKVVTKYRGYRDRIVGSWRSSWTCCLACKGFGDLLNWSIGALKPGWLTAYLYIVRWDYLKSVETPVLKVLVTYWYLIDPRDICYLDCLSLEDLFDSCVIYNRYWSITLSFYTI